MSEGSLRQKLANALWNVHGQLLFMMLMINGSAGAAGANKHAIRSYLINNLESLCRSTTFDESFSSVMIMNRCDVLVTAAVSRMRVFSGPRAWTIPAPSEL